MGAEEAWAEAIRLEVWDARYNYLSAGRPFSIPFRLRCSEEDKVAARHGVHKCLPR